MLYSYFAYTVLVIWFYHKTIYPFFKHSWPAGLLSILCWIPFQADLSVIDYLYSFFAQPSVLSVLLCILSWLPIVIPDKWLTGSKLKNLFRSVAKSVWWWIGITTIFIVFNAVGLMPKDIYQLIDTQGYFWLNYGVFLLFFIVAIILDTRFLVLAWMTLIAYTLGVMDSGHILDYIADFWLFIGLIVFLFVDVLRICLRICISQLKNLLKKPVPSNP